MRLGLYVPNAPDRLDELDACEAALGRPVDLVSIFQAWGSQYAPFNAVGLATLCARGWTPMISWEPWELARPGEDPAAQPRYALARLLDGEHDSYIARWAAAARAFDHEILLRPMHEMNGSWYPWGGMVGENSPSLYVAVWRKLHTAFREAGAARVRWVWSPYAVSYPPGEANAWARYYPGDDVVDWVGLDGYNWGSTRPDARWESCAEIFGPAYAAVTALTDKPLMIAETACAEAGGDKAAWIREAFAWLRAACPRVEALVWFHARKDCDWRIDSSPEARAAFRAAAGG